MFNKFPLRRLCRQAFMLLISIKRVFWCPKDFLFVCFILTSLAVHPDKITIATGQVAGTSSDGKVRSFSFWLFKYCIQICLIWCFHPLPAAVGSSCSCLGLGQPQHPPHSGFGFLRSRSRLPGFLQVGTDTQPTVSAQFFVSFWSSDELRQSVLAWFYDVRTEGTGSVSSTTPTITSSRSGTGRGRTDWLKLRSVYFYSFNLLPGVSLSKLNSVFCATAQCSNESVFAADFHPTDSNVIVTCGKSHLYFWTLEKGGTLVKKQGLFEVIMKTTGCFRSH